MSVLMGPDYDAHDCSIVTSVESDVRTGRYHTHKAGSHRALLLGKSDVGKGETSCESSIVAKKVNPITPAAP